MGIYHLKIINTSWVARIRSLRNGRTRRTCGSIELNSCDWTFSYLVSKSTYLNIQITCIWHIFDPQRWNDKTDCCSWKGINSAGNNKSHYFRPYVLCWLINSSNVKINCSCLRRCCCLKDIACSCRVSKQRLSTVASWWGAGIVCHDACCIWISECIKSKRCSGLNIEKWSRWLSDIAWIHTYNWLNFNCKALCVEGCSRRTCHGQPDLNWSRSKGTNDWIGKNA